MPTVQRCGTLLRTEIIRLSKDNERLQGVPWVSCCLTAYMV